jgi:hypothetical protein
LQPGRYVVGDFLANLASALPVLPPKGVIFQDFYKHWTGDGPITDGDVPPSVAHALARLHETGQVVLEEGSDAPDPARFVYKYRTDSQAEIATQVSRVRIP